MDTLVIYNTNYARLLKMSQNAIINEAIRRGFISAIYAHCYYKYSVDRLARFVTESIIEIAKS